MISYPIYKIIHLTSLFIFFTSASLYLLGNNKAKVFKILSGVSTLFILVSGMGLLARIGISHGEPFPIWVLLKFLIWGILGIGIPVLAKRFTKLNTAGYISMLFLFILAAYLVNYKP